MARYEVVYRKRRIWPWLLAIWIAFLVGSYAASNKLYGPPRQPVIGALPPAHPLPLAPVGPR